MRIMIRAPLIVFILAVPLLVSAQCDTASVNQAVRNIEELIWSDYPKAIALAESSVVQFRGSGPGCEAKTLLALAKTRWVNGDYGPSITILHRALKLEERAEDKETIAKCLLVMGNNYYFQGYYDSAEHYFIRSRDAFVEVKQRAGQIEVLHDMALMYHRQGNYAVSLKYMLETERLKDLEPDFIHYVGNFTLGNTYLIDTLYYKNEIKDEIASMIQFAKVGNTTGIWQSMINLGVAYQELGDHRRAGYYGGKGSAMMKQMGRYPFWYFAGKEYALAGMRDSCFYFHARAKEEIPRATQIKVATTYQLLGDSFYEFREADSALYYYDLALRLNQKMNNRITVPGVYLSLARVYMMKGNLDDAERMLEAGLQNAKGVSIRYTSELCEFGQALYEKRNDASRALFFAKKHAVLTDSINRSENSVAMIGFQVQFESERKELELIEARNKVRNRTIILASLAFITSLSLGFMITLYFQRQKIRRQNLKLIESNAEQKALMQEIHHRVKNNLQYIVSLLSLQSQTVNNSEVVRQIEQIKTRIVTIGIIHQRLYQSQGVQAVELSSFLHELIANMLNALPTRVAVKQNLEIDPIRVDVETAISLGLIVNELVTNSVKHAFVNHPAPELRLSIIRQEGELVIQMSDNGPGFVLKKTSGEGFGIRLIELLLRKLKGTLVQVNANTLHMRVSGFVIAEA